MAACPHFRNLFNQGLSGEKHFRLPPGIDSRVFQIILGYLYGGDIKDQVEALCGVGGGEGLAAAASHSLLILDNLIDSAKFLGLDDLFSKLDQFRRRRDEIAAAAAATAASVAPPPPPQLTDASSESRDERYDDDDDDDNSDTYSLPTQVPLDLNPQSIRKRAQCSKPK